MRRELKSFTSVKQFKGKQLLRLVIWTLIQNSFFKNFIIHSKLRVFLLRCFGSKIGKGVKIRRGVKVHFPWNLEIGDFCWIGEEVWIINHEKVSFDSNVCISQRSIICSGGHNYKSASLEFAHKPIKIRDGAWICLDAKVLPGVTIGECSVVSAGEIVRQSLPDYSMLINGRVRPIDSPK